MCITMIFNLLASGVHTWADSFKNDSSISIENYLKDTC